LLRLLPQSYFKISIFQPNFLCSSSFKRHRPTLVLLTVNDAFSQTKTCASVGRPTCILFGKDKCKYICTSTMSTEERWWIFLEKQFYNCEKYLLRIVLYLPSLSDFAEIMFIDHLLCLFCMLILIYEGHIVNKLYCLICYLLEIQILLLYYY